MGRLAWLLVGMIALIVGAARPAVAESSAEMLARMPGGEAVYGLAFGPDGQLYASDADGLRAGMVFIYTSSGDLVDRVTVPAGPTGVIALRGLAFDSRGNLYLADVANGQAGRGRIVKYTTRGRFSVLASGLTAPTGLAFDRSDVLYVTDGVNGAVLWIGLDGTSASFVEDDRLRPRRGSGLGASGLAFAPGDAALYVSNSADDRILRVSINSDGSAGRVSLFADGPSLRSSGRGGSTLDGPEGLAVDSRGNLLVAASRADEIEMFSSDGRLLDRISSNSSSLFSRPTSLVASGRSVYVASLSPEGGGSHLSRFALSELSDD